MLFFGQAVAEHARISELPVDTGGIKAFSVLQ